MKGDELSRRLAEALGWKLVDDSRNGVAYFELVDSEGKCRGGGTLEHIWNDERETWSIRRSIRRT